MTGSDALLSARDNKPSDLNLRGFVILSKEKIIEQVVKGQDGVNAGNRGWNTAAGIWQADQGSWIWLENWPTMEFRSIKTKIAYMMWGNQRAKRFR